MDDLSRSARVKTLESCGATAALIDELLAYGRPPAAVADVPAPACPLADEPLVESWIAYVREAQTTSPLDALRRHFAQLRCPIRAGISQEDAYREATLRGHFDAADAYAPGLALERPDALALSVCDTIGGRVPVIVAGSRADFVTLVRAFSERNEPAVVPDAMGACIVRGLNDWSRVASYRAAWERTHDGADDEAWAEEFRRLLPQKALYQDRLILLSRGPYSAIAGGACGFSGDEWLARSLVIRREHEFTHYFVYRAFGVMRSHVFDELVADYVGLLRGIGRYEAAAALGFLGFDTAARWHVGGRLAVYRGDLSDDAFLVVQRLAVRSTRNLEALAATRRDAPDDLEGLGRLIWAISGLALEDLAGDDLPDLVSRRLS